MLIACAMSRPEIGDEMTQAVFLLRADGVVGEQHRDVASGQVAHRVVHVNPGVHPLARAQLGPRRAEFRGDHGRAATERVDQ